MIFKENAQAQQNMPAEGLPVTQAKDVAGKSYAGDKIRLKADVVVIGSGAGGAVAAYELASKGKSVIILEAGRYIDSSKFKEQLGNSLKDLYVNEGMQTNTAGDFNLMQGACVGGSTVINAAVSYRAPDETLKVWSEDHGLTNLSPENMAPYYEKVEKLLHVQSNESHELNSCSHKLIEGCERMDIEWKPVARAVKNCALTGHCLSGCPSDRKMTMLVTYLPWAVAHGAQIYSDTFVTNIRDIEDRVAGVDAEVRDPNTGKVITELSVDAHVVITAAGAIQTPQILQRSKLYDFSGLTGRNLFTHPYVRLLAKFDEPLYAWRGALTGVHIDQYLKTDGMLFESGITGPEMLVLQGEHGNGKSHIKFMKDYKNMASMNIYSTDHTPGSVRWDVALNGTGSQKIDWNLSEETFENFKKSIAIGARVYFSAGAKKVYMPTYQELVANSVFELDAILDQITYGDDGSYTFRTSSTHPQGTVRMGNNSVTSVVDQYGESHALKGLFVADASLFPTEIPVNPQTTVSALATYVADNILKRKADYFIV